MPPTPPKTESKELSQNDASQQIEPPGAENTVEAKEEKQSSLPNEVSIAVPTDQANTGAEPENTNSIDNTVVEDQITPTSPHVSTSRRTRGEWYQTYDDSDSESGTEVIPKRRLPGVLARRGTARNL